MSVTAIIPAKNEGISIGSIVIKTKRHVDRVIVIDDGSIDDTASIARSAGAEIIRHQTNKGKGEALKTGFYEARKNGTKIIVTIDGDGQHDPDEIPKLIEPIKLGMADIVIGSRFLNGNEIPFIRRLGQLFLDKSTSLNCGIKSTDSQSGFRAFAIHTVPKFRFMSKGFSIESEMLEDAADAGFRIKDIDINVRYMGLVCSSENFLIHGAKLFFHTMQSIEFKRPLIFTIAGLLLEIIGTLMGLYYYERYLNGGGLSFGPTILMLLIILIGASLVFSGIILHMIKKYFQELKDLMKREKFGE